MTVKYILAPESGLYRLTAAVTIPGVVGLGEQGGLVANASSLSHEGACWVSPGAFILQGATVADDAQIVEEATVTGSATVRDSAVIGGTALVSGNSVIRGTATVEGVAITTGDAYLDSGTVSAGTFTENLQLALSAKIATEQPEAIAIQHNDLSGIQGGVADEHYHLTVAQATIASQAASGTVPGHVTTGAQTLAGTKTFVSSPLVPTVPAAGGAAVNKDYVTSAQFKTDLDLQLGDVETLERQLAINSAGIWTLPSVSVNEGAGTVTVGTGVYALHPAVDGSTYPRLYTIAGGTYSLTADVGSVVCADYNSGTPQLIVTTNADLYNYSTIVPIFSLVWSAGEIHNLSWDEQGKMLVCKILDRLVRSQRFMVEPGGLALGEVATRVITVTAGRVWHGAKAEILGALNIATDVEKSELWTKTGGVWGTVDITQYSNTQYQNGANVATLTAGRYAVNWVYRCSAKEHVFVVLGGDNYTLVQAQGAAAPAALPPTISTNGVLIGRIIVQKSASSATQIDSALTTQFTSSLAVDHADLANLQGGTAGEYYHLTAAQGTTAGALLAAGAEATAGLLTETAPNTFSKRSIAVGSTRLTVTNPAGVAGNPTLDATDAGAAQSGVVNLAGQTLGAGVKNFSSVPTTSGGDSAGTGTQQLASTKYVQSRGENLITNGTGLLGSNYNFTGYAFDQVDTFAGGGSFSINVSLQARFNDELIPVDTSQYYRLTLHAKSGDIGGANYNAGNVQYLGVAEYDIDGNPIAFGNTSRRAGSALTTLAAQLNNGDTTITLTDATGWYSGAAATSRHIAWWPYANSLGYSYPAYTYTRHLSDAQAAYTSGTWASGGITGNVITLVAPWAGGTVAAGSPVRNMVEGSSYKYSALLGGTIPNVWTEYSARFGTVMVGDSTTFLDFAYGTAYIKFLQLINYHGAADNRVRISGLSITNLSSGNIEAATDSIPGVVSIGAQTLAGVKTFTSSPSIPTATPASSSAAGTTGQIAWDSTYLYVCTAANTWKRILLTTW